MDHIGYSWHEKSKRHRRRFPSLKCTRVFQEHPLLQGILSSPLKHQSASTTAKTNDMQTLFLLFSKFFRLLQLCLLAFAYIFTPGFSVPHCTPRLSNHSQCVLGTHTACKSTGPSPSNICQGKASFSFKCTPPTIRPLSRGNTL